MEFNENYDLQVPKCNQCFIYFLVKNNEVVYVGQTKNGLIRPLTHKDKEYDDIFVKYCDKKQLNDAENYYIIKYKPRYNRNIGNIIKLGLKKVACKIRGMFGWKDFDVEHARKLAKILNIKVETEFEMISIFDFYKMVEFIGRKLDAKRF